jgi:hypothetical protein
VSGTLEVWHKLDYSGSECLQIMLTAQSTEPEIFIKLVSGHTKLASWGLCYINVVNITDFFQTIAGYFYRVPRKDKFYSVYIIKTQMAYN